MENGLREQGLAHGHDRLAARLEALGMPTRAIDALLSRYTIVRYPKGSLLFARGAPADIVFVVMSGMVKVCCARERGMRTLIDLAGPGDPAGYADFSDGQGARSQLFDAEALTNACVALLTRDHVIRVLRELEPVTILTLAENVNSLWARATHRFARFLGMTLRERLEAVFAEIGERFGVEDARGVLLTPELEQEGLAEMIGGSRPMVSKLLMEMKQEGVIARDGRHYVLLRKRAGLHEATEGLGAASQERTDAG